MEGYIKYAISVYVIGLLVFYTTADAYSVIYEKTYFVWDKGKDLLLFLALYSGYVKYRKIIKPILIFSLIRLLWDLISNITKVDKNHYQAVNILLGSLLLILTLICLKELRQWQKQRH